MVESQSDAKDGESNTGWQKLKDEGNKLFMDGHHLKAAAVYTTAIKVRAQPADE
jgi:hypothetical protein